MNRAAAVAGALLGLGFVFFGVLYFVKFANMPLPPQDGSAMAMFTAAFATTGYMKFVKILEIAGGLLTAIPKTRPVGLLVLGPVLVNIVAFHAFVMAGAGLKEPTLLILLALFLFLVWSHRKGIEALVTTR